LFQVTKAIITIAESGEKVGIFFQLERGIIFESFFKLVFVNIST
jgi:hypothetical protein